MRAAAGRAVIDALEGDAVELEMDIAVQGCTYVVMMPNQAFFQLPCGVIVRSWRLMRQLRSKGSDYLRLTDSSKGLNKG